MIQPARVLDMPVETRPFDRNISHSTREQAGRRSGPRVLIAPYKPGNPYQEQLAYGLKQAGCQVEFFPHLTAAYQKGIRAGDILHLHWPPVAHLALAGLGRIGVFLWRLRRLSKSGTRIVWTVHNELPHDSPLPFANLFIARRIAHYAHRIICHSDQSAEHIARRYQVSLGKMRVVPHGNYLSCYPNRIRPADARRALGLAPDTTTVLFLGQIRPYKGVGDLIAAFRKTKSPKLRLILAGKPGGGIRPQDIADSINGDERVQTHLRHIEDDEIQTFMNAADVAVFPYRKALTSGAISLAMSFAKPILSFDNIAAASVAEGGSILVGHSGKNSLTEALEDLTAVRERFASMGAANLAKAKQCDWSRIGLETLAIYRES